MSKHGEVLVAIINNKLDFAILREHDLNTGGWKVFHFTEKQIREQAESYCIETVSENINKLGGVDEGKIIPRKRNLDKGSYQPSLFDGL